MKKKLIFAIAALGMLACTGKNNPDKPDNSQNQGISETISCSPNTIIAGESGGEFNVTVTSKSEWSATANSSWVTISPNSGQGDAFVTINVETGEKAEVRVMFSNGEGSATLVVYRENIICDPTVKTVSPTGEEFSVKLKTHASWTATSDKSCVTITPKSGQGDASVTITVSADINDEARVLFNDGNSSATLTIYCKMPDTQAEGGLLPGKFSVSASKQVQFSQGNLLYQASTRTWRFANNQCEYVQGNPNTIISDSYIGWIDLFGWGTGYNPTNYSIDSYNDYSTFVDWGKNAISNGGNKSYQWRTLTQKEWVYLFKTRSNASRKYGMASVAGVNGIIILPDIYDGTSINTSHNAWSNNTISASDWASYEELGAVFLPATGSRDGRDVHNGGNGGSYWSATPSNGSGGAYGLIFNSSSLDIYAVYCHIGRPVRLVKDVE